MPTDSKLHEMARKRIEFRAHLVSYIILNGFLWIIWLVTGQGYIWPIWPTAGWGIGVLFHYFFEYRSPKFLSEEEEYIRLKEKFEKQ